MWNLSCLLELQKSQETYAALRTFMMLLSEMTPAYMDWDSLYGLETSRYDKIDSGNLTAIMAEPATKETALDLRGSDEKR